MLEGESAPCHASLPHIYVPARGQVSHIYIQAHVEHAKLHYFVVVVYLAVKLQPFNNKFFSTHIHHSTGRIMGPAIGQADVLGKTRVRGSSPSSSREPQVLKVPSGQGGAAHDPAREDRWKPGSGEERGDKNRSDAGLPETEAPWSACAKSS